MTVAPAPRSPIRRGRRWRRAATLAATCAVLLSGCKYSWLQFGGSSAHGSDNTYETTITPANVSGLHRVWQTTLPATVDSAPVYLAGASTPSGTRNVVFVTTRAGTLVELDATTGAVLWSVGFPAGTCKINNGTTACYTTSAPAIDPGGSFVYTYGLDGSVHKLAVSNGAETLGGGWPELVTLKGFDEKGSSQLSIATAASGKTYLYAVTAGYPGDRGDYQGHLVAIDLGTGTQKVFNTLCSNLTVHFVTAPGSPDCAEVQSGVWARAGTIYDAANDRLFISSGNGTFDPANHQWGDTVLALHPDGTAADANGTPLDGYTPANFSFLDTSDQDLGSTLPAIIPTIPGAAHAHLGLMGGKDAKLRLIDLDDMSGHGAAGNTGGEIGPVINVPQGGQTLTQPAVWTNPSDSSVWAFVANASGTSALKIGVDGAGNPTLTTMWQTTTAGTSPLVANGILFTAAGTRVGAYDPLTGANLWQDTTIGSVHWQTPVVANGFLYMTDGSAHLDAYQP